MKFIFPTILILASIGAFLGYINPQYQTVKALMGERAGYQEALTNSRALMAKRDELVSTYNTIPGSNISRLEELLPDHVDNVRLIMDLSSIASRYGLTLTNIKNIQSSEAAKGEITTDSSGIGSATLNFSVSAPYSTFQAFLGDLEKSLRIVDVSSISFSASDGSPNYDFNIGVKTYWLK
ncbi:MAG: type 4a pilus biogenesis protein PilO [Candidatus Paceibacterota bacterium]|jgi:hypothetical protein